MLSAFYWCNVEDREKSWYLQKVIQKKLEIFRVQYKGNTRIYMKHGSLLHVDHKVEDKLEEVKNLLVEVAGDSRMLFCSVNFQATTLNSRCPLVQSSDNFTGEGGSRRFDFDSFKLSIWWIMARARIVEKCTTQEFPIDGCIGKLLGCRTLF